MIHHIGTHEGAPYIVSELLEGQTLRERVTGAALPQRKAIDYALQTARGLSAAHAKGITHRDLKPENLFITSDGRVKILDFGLAKLTSTLNSHEVQTDAPTRKVNTDPGTVMGTVGYMAPEQLKGATADHRSDIFSFGAVLYEMLSGKRAFRGDSLAETMSAILREDPPDLSATNKSISPALDRVVNHCLEKNPEERFQSARDLAFALEALSGATSLSDQTLQVEPAAPLRGRGRGRALWIGAMAVMLLAALALLFLLYFRRSPDNRAGIAVIRVVEEIPPTQAASGQSRNRLALSADGTKLAYAANRRLYLRSLDSLVATELPGTEGATNPFFSPDGKWIGFLVGASEVKKVAIQGGTSVTICPTNIAGASWGPDNKILLGAMYSGILLVSANGGKPTTIVAPRPSIAYVHPQILPDGRSFLYTRGRGGSQYELMIRSFDKDDETVLLTGGYSYHYLKSGHLIYSQPAGALRVDLAAVAFDVASRKVLSNPVIVAKNVRLSTATSSSQFAISDAGTLAYLPVLATEALGTRLITSDRQGEISRLPTELRDYSDPRVSPDGRQVAVHLQDAQNDIWIADVARGTLSRLSYNPGEDETPAWSPDGRTVVWAASTPDLARGIFRRPVDESRSAALIWKLDEHAHVRDWTPDSRSLVLEIRSATTSSDIWRLDLQGEPTATVFLQTQFNEHNSRLSPDGHWLVYVSDESGRDEVYVQSFPEGGSKLQVSTAGGDEPVWSRDGRTIIIRRDGLIEEIPFQPGLPPSLGSTRTLFPDRFQSPQAGGHTGYDVFPDGRLLMIQASEQQDTAREQIIFVFNWIEELKRSVPIGSR